MTTSAPRTKTPKSRLMSFERVGSQARLMQLQPSPARARAASQADTPPPPTRPVVVQLTPTPNSPHSPYRMQAAVTASPVPRGSGVTPRVLVSTPAAVDTPPAMTDLDPTPDIDDEDMMQNSDTDDGLLLAFACIGGCSPSHII